MNASNEILSSIFAADAALFAPPRFDAEMVSSAVTRYATSLGCDLSNTSAAVTWALKTPSELGTLAAVRAGRQRASQLFWRQRK